MLGFVDTIRLLIDAGANTRLWNKDRKTAIIIAVARKNSGVISTSSQKVSNIGYIKGYTISS